MLWMIRLDEDTTPLISEFFKLRRREAKERHNMFKTPNLHVTNEQFFKPRLPVERSFIHDHIHEMVKHHDRPVYEMMKRDFSLAKCEKDMFEQLPFDLRIQAVQEEAYTIALERYIIPQKDGMQDDPFRCYKKAVERICTTLCSGWFRVFAIENYFTIIERYDSTFVDRFWSKYESGEIKPLKGKVPPKYAPVS